MASKRLNPFKLRDFVGVNPDQIAKLTEAGVKTTTQMLSAGQTAEGRATLANRAGISMAI